MSVYRPPKNINLPFSTANFSASKNKIYDLISIETADRYYVKRYSTQVQYLYGNFTMLGNWLRRRTPSWCCFKAAGTLQAAPATITYNTNLVNPIDVSVNLSTGIITINTFGFYWISFMGFTNDLEIFANCDMRMYKNGTVSFTRQFTNKPANFYMGGLNMCVLISCAAGDQLSVKLEWQNPLHQNSNCYFAGFKIC